MCFWGRTRHFHMEAKVPKMLSGKPNPFIDPAGISDIARWEKSYLEQVAKERTESNEIVPSGSGMKFDLNG